MNKLMWTGVLCCIGALALNLFPALTYELGVGEGGAWPFFGFGLFLILISLILSRGERRCSHEERGR
ncbi:MAG: hypothetical protein WD076_06680 [Parvularculaceae bacterium]